jgi:hypothetical protein
VLRQFSFALILFASMGSVYATDWVEAYPGSSTVKLGETLDIHISGTIGEASIDIIRNASSYTKIVLATNVPVVEHPVIAEQPWRTGADWPVGFSFEIPEDWQPGFYIIAVHDASNANTYEQFIVGVQPADYGEHSKVAVLLNDATKNAYTKWGGKNNYRSDIPGEPRANVVSFSRPDVHKYSWVDWQLPKWLDYIGVEVEYISSLDLHYQAGLLDAYEVLVLSGHSEYWSREMRHALEEFLERGGKLISLSGNTMWWAVRFEETPTGVQMISCKGWDNDPVCQRDNPDMFTGYWRDMGEPESRVFGASFAYGGYVDALGFYPASEGYGGYFAERAKHWFWAGTSVLSGDHVGQEAGIAGYEADAPPIIFSRGKPIVDPTATDLPDGIEILATTPAATPNWEGNGAIIYFTYGDNGGEVFNCGSVDCSEGLITDPAWRKAMLNVFARFGVLEASLTDYDSDDIDDVNDNCIDTYNPDQLDSFSDGTGDACDQHCH